MDRTFRKKNKIKIRQVGTAVCIAAVLFLSTGISYKRLQFDRASLVRQSALLCSEQKQEIEKGTYKENGYPCMYVDLRGKVLYASKPFLVKKGSHIAMEEEIEKNTDILGNHGDRYLYRTVLTQDDEMRGTIYFLVPYEKLQQKTERETKAYIFFPVFMGIALSVLILVVKGILEIRYLFCIMDAISLSAQEIIRGNYDKEVLAVQGDEIRNDEMGELIYSFELMRDEIKEKQIREEQMKKSQQELISCISHDLKTPISTIKAYAEGMRDGIAVTKEDYSMYTDVIIKKTNLLIDMIEELLEFSNAQLRQLNIMKTEVYFYPYFISLMKEMAVCLEQQGGELEWSYHTENCLVLMDSKRITEVFYNLMENSIKYRSERKLRMEVEVTYREGILQIAVRDNGIGISLNDIPFIFDKFYRAEKSRTSAIAGSGLGLSICKYIIEEHDGSISCKNQKEGCEILLKLPVFS